MVAAMISDFGFLSLKLQDIFEMQIVNAVLDGEPEYVGVVVTFDLFCVARKGVARG